MKISYKVLPADITPEALGYLRDKKIILESSSNNQQKGRYSIVAFEPYGRVELNHELLRIWFPSRIIKETLSPYEKLKTFINQYHEDIKDPSLAHLPFVSGFIGTCSFDLVRHAFPKLMDIPIEGDSSDLKFYMIESVYVFDHYKELLYVISSNLFSEFSEY